MHAGMKNARSKGGPARRMRPAKGIDGYLASVPKPQRALLERLCRTIRAAAPKAIEKIAYGMPAFYDPGPLVAFAAFKDHCSFFPMSLATMGKFKQELKGYEGTKGSIHFTVDGPLPAALVRKIVKARIAENAERARIRKERRAKK